MLTTFSGTVGGQLRQVSLYNDKKWNQKKMKECDKRKNHTSSKLHTICISANNVRPSLHFTQLHLTPLHYICRHFTSSHLNFTQLHFTTLSFGLTTFKFPTAPFHLTSLHLTSLHFTALLDDFRHTSILSLHPVYTLFARVI